MDKIQYAQTIPLELVGRNQDLRVLKSPFKGNLLGIGEALYTDDYLRALDKTSLVKKVFGKFNLPLNNEFKRKLYWSVGNTPFQNTESEDVLRQMLWRSVESGSWQPYIQSMRKEDPQRIVAELMKIREMPKERYTGPGYVNPDPIAMATRLDLSDDGRGIHFSEPTTCDVNGFSFLILVPTEHLAKYVQEKFGK